MILQRLAQFDEDIELLDAKIDLIEAFDDVVDIVGQVLGLCHPDPPLYLLIFLLVASSFGLLLLLSLLFLLLLFLLLILLKFLEALCLPGSERQPVLLGFEEGLLFFEIAVLLVLNELIYRTLALLHDTQIKQLLGHALAPLRHQDITINIVLHRLGRHIVANLSNLLPCPHRPQLPLRPLLLLLSPLGHLVLLLLGLLLVVALLLVVLAGVVRGAVLVVSGAAALSFAALLNLDIEGLGVLPLLLPQLDFGFNCDLLHVASLVVGGQVLVLSSTDTLQFFLQPPRRRIIFYDVGSPDEQEGSALRVYLHVL